MLKDKLRGTVLKDIENLDLMHLSDYSKFNSKIIRYFFSQKDPKDKKSLEEALETAVLAKAENEYSDLITTTRPYEKFADDMLVMTECLAYGISHNLFSDKKLKKIPFDHGETPEEYCRVYGNKNLLSDLRKKLVNPPKTPFDF